MMSLQIFHLLHELIDIIQLYHNIIINIIHINKYYINRNNNNTIRPG